jgi:hypothetical protein
MRIVERATPLDAYHVFKLLKDYAEDTNQKKPTMADYEKLLQDLLDPNKIFSIIMHGRMAAGMFWGEIDRGQFVVLGRYLRRKFRTFKFKRTLVEVGLQTTKQFDTLRYILPPNTKISRRLKQVAIVAEEVR